MVPLREQRMPGVPNIAFIRRPWCCSTPFPEYIYRMRKLAKADGRMDARITRYLLTVGEVP